MKTTDAQVRKLMEEMAKHGQAGLAAARAGMDRKTGRKYVKEGKLPSELASGPREWRTRENPFVEDWGEVVEQLRDAPELEARTLFELLCERHPERYQPGQLRTLQRHIARWRALEGPEREVFFAQEHRPGEAMQTDFTHATELGVTIRGEVFAHLLCHPVLPYSNWEWATVCRSESLAALTHGVQEALFRLGRRPAYHQTDNSTGATHQLSSGKRGFNQEYVRLMEHLGMTPRTIQVGKSNQNGDAEALNGALKRRLRQHLLVRGSRDFDSLEAYQAWLQQVLEKANRQRVAKVAEELAVMQPLSVARMAEYREEDVVVTAWSTIRVKHNAYSVPSRLVGKPVRVRVYEDRLEVRYCGEHQLTVRRLLGRNGHRINYRHIIWSLVQKPWAFSQYKYREELFPSLTFRQAYDGLKQGRSEREGDLEYLRLLHLAASTLESEVEAVLQQMLAAGEALSGAAVKARVTPVQPQVPALEVPQVDLDSYDALLGQGEEVAS